jgi:hypothetical protein
MNTRITRSQRERATVPVFALTVALLMVGTVAFANGQSEQAEVTEDLDLREANVTAVEVETSGTGVYRFDVTLLHDDDGEDGYANWWQVETLAGERLGRRELLHAHGTVEFTRSETIEIPSDVEWVVIRGHDQSHGYGGQAAIMNVETGDLEFVRQGSEPRDFSNRSADG